ncbi:uncharacterized protein BDV14DRAFT_206474 [Aspergillus stella-maris]|uniref:uncharacterized protein n=1 Tax=Aspergillus stella-maris TaxID=1810926 RepID=UPI003CCD3EFB
MLSLLFLTGIFPSNGLSSIYIFLLHDKPHAEVTNDTSVSPRRKGFLFSLHLPCFSSVLTSHPSQFLHFSVPHLSHRPTRRVQCDSTIFIFVAALLLSAADARCLYILNWSTEAYGPDGPWQAVTINVGSDRQPIALYPGANYASIIFADSICANSTLSPTCYVARAGTYNESDSATSISTGSPTSNASTLWNILYWSVQGEARQESIGDEVTLGVGESETIIPNVSFTAIYDTYQTYYNGRSYPVSVGNLALGAPRLRDASSGLSLNMIASWLYTSGPIPSYSYSMHIGSGNPPIPGSLVVGGYDRTRLIGEGSTQSIVDSAGTLQIVLRDIGLGVAEGASPFPVFTDTHRGGLFLDAEHGENMDMGTVLPRTVTIDPTKPYMYLPAATCDAITAFSPYPSTRG